MHPVPVFQNVPITNPNAPLAFFGESTANSQMRYEYAVALQKAGLYNFSAENFSEEDIENAIEIRLNYSEERGNFNGIPVLVLKTEILKNNKVWFMFTIKETSDKNNLNNLRTKKLEKNFRKHVLLERFLEEVKRVSPGKPSSSNKG
jgi:hypothetical protein